MPSHKSNRKKLRLHVKRSQKSFGKAVEAACINVCINIAEKTANAILAGKDKVTTLQFNHYSKCKRECYSARLGKRYHQHD